MNETLDVFLSYNSADVSSARKLAKLLKRSGIAPFFDEWQISAGDLWLEKLEEHLKRCRSCAILVGQNGVGPWEKEEMMAALWRQKNDPTFRVIPILLPGGDSFQKLPMWLQIRNRINFVKSLDEPEPLRFLINSIRGEMLNPEDIETDIWTDSYDSLRGYLKNLYQTSFLSGIPIPETHSQISQEVYINLRVLPQDVTKQYSENETTYRGIGRHTILGGHLWREYNNKRVGLEQVEHNLFIVRSELTRLRRQNKNRFNNFRFKSTKPGRFSSSKSKRNARNKSSAANILHKELEGTAFFPKMEPQYWNLLKREGKIIEQRKKLIQEIRKTKHDLHVIESTVSKSSSEFLQKHDVVVIVGMAGAGKTTLLKQFALNQLATREIILPLIVNLGRLGRLLNSNSDTLMNTLLDLFVEHLAGEDRSLQRASIENAISERNVIFLFDSLDEAHQNQTVIEGIQKLISAGYRLVITTRPFGYQRIPDIPHCELLQFNPKETHLFVKKWFETLARSQGVEETEHRDWSESRTELFMKQLNQLDHFEEITRNPLMLTFVAALAKDDPAHRLPKNRCDIYLQYLNKLITSWQRCRQNVCSFLDLPEANILLTWGLSWIGYQLHLENPETKNSTFYSSVESELASAIGIRWELREIDALGYVTEILKFWRDIGILDVVQLSESDRFSFRHHTIQEFATAWYLADLYRENPQLILTELSHHVWSPTWKQVVIMATVLVKDSTDIVSKLLRGPSCENNESKTSVLGLEYATAAIIEGAQIDRVTRKKIIHDLTTFASANRWEAAAWLSSLASISGEDVEIELIRLVKDPSLYPEVRLQAASALNELGKNDLALKEIIEITSQKKLEPTFRVFGAACLWKIGRASNATNMLRKAMLDSRLDVFEKQLLVQGLSSIGAIEGLVIILYDRKLHMNIRYRSADGLAKHNRIDTLEKFAQDSKQYPEARLYVLELLIKISTNRIKISEILLRIAENSKLKIKYNRSAIKSILKIDRSDLVLNLACTPGVNESIRLCAAKTLIEFPNLHLKAWLALATDRSVSQTQRKKAINRLQRFKATSQFSIALKSLSTDPKVEGSIRFWAGERLLKFSDNNSATSAFLGLVDDVNIDPQTKIRVADYLLHLGQSNASRNLLFTLTQNKRISPQIRINAASKLIQAGFSNQAVTAFKTIAFDSTVDTPYRCKAAKKLQDLQQPDLARRIWKMIANDFGVVGGFPQEALKSLQQLGCYNEAVDLVRRLSSWENPNDAERLKFALKLQEFEKLQESWNALEALVIGDSVTISVRHQAVQFLKSSGYNNFGSLISSIDPNKNTLPLVFEIFFQNDLSGDLKIFLNDCQLPYRSAIRLIKLFEKITPDVGSDFLLLLGSTSCGEPAIQNQVVNSLQSLGRCNDLLEMAKVDHISREIRIAAVSAAVVTGKKDLMPQAAAIVVSLSQDVKETIESGNTVGDNSRLKRILYSIVKRKDSSESIRTLSAQVLFRMKDADLAEQTLIGIITNTANSIATREKAIIALSDLKCIRCLFDLLHNKYLNYELKKIVLYRIKNIQKLSSMEIKEVTRSLDSLVKSKFLDIGIRKAARNCLKHVKRLPDPS